ncbi:MAG: GNAT family N-acetyltransferase [Candidatus Aminicenantales bacterium]
MEAKTETLKDGTKVTIRNLTLDDLDKMMKFYRSLPPEDRKYLKIDVTNRQIVEQRIRLTEKGNVIRIIALLKDEIIADGMLELITEEWRKHQGEIRVIVASSYRRKRLGLIMMRELYFLAVQKNVESILVEMMRPQIGAQKICRILGFREEALLPDYVRDQTGESQDLIIMTCNIKHLWEELDHLYSNSDWQRCR